MKCLRAVEQVLRESGQPLHSGEITKRILKSGLWKSKGKTPEQTVYSRLYSDIRTKKDESLFIQVAPGTFSLRENQFGKSDELLPDSGEKENLGGSESTLSFLDAAEKVLEHFGNKNPMHYAEITNKAIESGWLSTSSKIPKATMSALLSTEIKRANSKGTTGRFTRISRGNYGLVKWVGTGLLQQISRHNRDIRKKLLSEVMALTPSQFEELVGYLLVEMGFEAIEVTQPGGDGGIDVRGTLLIGDAVRIKMAVQAKRWKGSVQSSIIREVRGSLVVHEQGLIITTGKFTTGAIRDANQSDKSPVALMDGEKLVTLLMEYEIGVQRASHHLFELRELPKSIVVKPDQLLT